LCRFAPERASCTAPMTGNPPSWARLDGIPGFDEPAVPMRQARADPPQGRSSMRQLRAVAAAYGRHRFAWLFATLLVTLGPGSPLDALLPHHNPLGALLALNLLAAIASVAHERDMRLPLLLGIIFVVAHVLRAAVGIPGMLAVSDGVWLAAIVLTMIPARRHGVRRGGGGGEGHPGGPGGKPPRGLFFRARPRAPRPR